MGIISDIFSSTFLISLAITLFIASMLYMYISNKFAEQNHKINSMFSLISTMAEEQQYFRVKLVGKGLPTSNIENENEEEEEEEQEVDEDNMKEDLISVSDNQDEDEYSDYEEEEEEEEEGEDEEVHTDNMDILNLGLINPDNLGLENDLDLEKQSNASSSTIDLNNIKTIHLEEAIILDEPTNNEFDLSSEINMDDHDNNTINTLDIHSKQGYKKMSLNKLREVAVEKGVIQDASKLKKNELLKLLEEE